MSINIQLPPSKSEIEIDVIAATGPNDKGEFATPLAGALYMAKFDIPVIWIPGDSKASVETDWPDKGTTNPEEIRGLWTAHPGCNFAGIGRQEIGKPFVWEFDSPDVRKRFEKATGRKLTDTTSVTSRYQRGHRWYLGTEESVSLGNLAQHAVIGGDFSVRMNHAYALLPGSVNPVSKKQYTLRSDVSPAPISSEEVAWLREQRKEKGVKVNFKSDEPIAESGRNNTLFEMGAMLCNAGLDEEQILSLLLETNRSRCVPPLPESEVRTIASSAAKRESHLGTTPLVGGKVAGMPAAVVPNAIQFEIDDADTFVRPQFPRWVFRGTSLEEGLVNPVCEASTKLPEFVFMPAVQLFLNILSGKVNLKYRPTVLNIYLGLISTRAKFFKSSSCEVAQDYFAKIGLLGNIGAGVNNADGKILVTSPSSPEGLGLSMARTNCRNALLYYDELKKFIKKAGIEASAFGSDLLTFYEAGRFESTVKSRKESFSFNPGTYCFGWLWCTTDVSFPDLWSGLSGITSGLDDRMFFVLSPETNQEPTFYEQPDLTAGTVKTRQLIDKAISQGTFAYEDYDEAKRVVSKLTEPRAIGLFERLALYFAADLGLDAIDSDCTERAIALVEYREKVYRYLDPGEAITLLGRLQMKMVRVLQNYRGQMTLREFERAMNYARYGSELWNAALFGLCKLNRVVLDATKYPKTVYLVKQED
jgi:Primase C terminal 1 (PriCT-1)/Bifunctional DNA primase/polymerase, N-terminal